MAATAPADFLHEDGKTYCIRRAIMDQDFTIYEVETGSKEV